MIWVIKYFCPFPLSVSQGSIKHRHHASCIPRGISALIPLLLLQYPNPYPMTAGWSPTPIITQALHILASLLSRGVLLMKPNTVHTFCNVSDALSSSLFFFSSYRNKVEKVTMGNLWLRVPSPIFPWRVLSIPLFPLNVSLASSFPASPGSMGVAGSVPSPENRHMDLRRKASQSRWSLRSHQVVGGMPTRGSNLTEAMVHI